MKKPFSHIQERFYWPGYWSDTGYWCLTCIECSTCKSSTHPRRAPLGTIQASYPHGCGSSWFIAGEPTERQVVHFNMLKPSYPKHGRLKDKSHAEQVTL